MRVAVLVLPKSTDRAIPKSISTAPVRAPGGRRHAGSATSLAPRSPVAPPYVEDDFDYDDGSAYYAGASDYSMLRNPYVLAGLAVAVAIVAAVFVVILFGSGLSSIIGNEIVKSLSWSTFLENLDPRLLKAWNKWMIGIGPIFEYIFLGGFLISVLFYRKVSHQKMFLPLQVFLGLAVAVLLFQRGVCLCQFHLEAFYLMFAAAGLLWLIELSLSLIASSTMRSILHLPFLAFIAALQISHRPHKTLCFGILIFPKPTPDYIAELEDTIVATDRGHSDGLLSKPAWHPPYHHKRDHPVEIQNAGLGDNAKYKTRKCGGVFKLDEA
jgi:hypothetical protein